MRRRVVIQISTPTQAPSSPQENGCLQDSGFIEGLSGNWSSKPQKKDKLGIFAKLLDNLTGKGKKGGLDAGNQKVDGQEADGSKLHGLNVHVLGPDSSAGAVGKTSHGRADKNASGADSGTKKTQNPGSGSIISAEKDAAAAVSGFFGHNQLSGQSPKSAQTGAGDLHSNGKERKTIPVAGSLASNASVNAAGPSRETNAGKEGVSGLTVGHADGKEAETLGNGFPVNRGKGGAAGSGSDKTKNTGNSSANIVSFSFRDAEAMFLQSQAGDRSVSGQAKPGNGEGENSKLSESRGKKGKEKLSSANSQIEVRDFRTGEGQNAGSAGLRGQSIDVSRPLHTEIEFPVDLSNPGGKGEGAAGKTGKTSSPGGSFEDALARELRGGLSTDIVRDASVIVRNGGEGTIRLSLRPASLGDVKIRLEMTENKITGHIVVESNEALRAFERELPVLEKAFRDSGFSETNLDMSLASEYSADGGNSGGREKWRDEDYPGLSPVMAASRYDAGFIGSDPADRIEAPLNLSGMLSSVSPGRKAVNLLV